MALTAQAGNKAPNALGMEVTDEEYAAIAAPYASPYNAVFQAGFNSVTATLGYHFVMDHKYRVFCNFRINNLLNNLAIVYNGTILLPYQDNYLSPARTQTLEIYGQYRAPVSFSFTTTTDF